MALSASACLRMNFSSFSESMIFIFLLFVSL
nr:MAG TPA: hypothetical protein [Caudoviricetes sp.]